MSRSQVVWTLLAGVAVATFAMLPVRAQDGAKPADAKGPEVIRILAEDEPDNEARVREALEQRVALQLKDMPLRDVADAVAKKFDITVVLNEQALTDEGVAMDVPITLHVSRISLRSALSLVLSPLQLRAIVTDGVLMITTAAEAVNYRTSRVYDITDLVEGRDDKAPMKLIGIIQQSTGGHPDGPWEAIDDEGGVAYVVSVGDSRLLVIRQTDIVHREIEQLLADIRAAR
jgi:hypothetical protein